MNPSDLADLLRRIQDWADQVSVPPEVLVPFTIQNLAASQTNLQLWYGSVFPASGASGDVAARQLGLTLPWIGSVAAISLTANAAKSAGAAAFEVWVNGVASGAILNWGNNDSDYVTFAREDFTFDEGDVLDIRVTTDGAYAPTTSEVAVALFLLRAP